jgi:7,8-dihydropterin-6-yl-methyl-4-(beta-D-ribofuranosyl)aminobenzene 5'-phosphate synthase
MSQIADTNVSKRPKNRFPYIYWPLLPIIIPLVSPVLALKYRKFVRNRKRAQEVNAQRMSRAESLALPSLQSLELTVLVEQRARSGFRQEAGVSYLFESDKGRLLMDLGFGAESGVIEDNAAKLNLSFCEESSCEESSSSQGGLELQGILITHHHLDHMGGMKAQRAGKIAVPTSLGDLKNVTVFLPERLEDPGVVHEVVESPRVLPAGLASTGPLARSLFFFGWTEEQAIIARLKDKGLVVFTGCGHPTLPVILEMVRRISSEPIYAIGGGLHFPVTEGRGQYGGIQVQTMAGTGKAPWDRIDDNDLNGVIEAIKESGAQKLFLSAHDTCDYAIERIRNEVSAELEVLAAGAKYTL